jgi:tetratricopeptide (TPR) repeat protein
MNRPIVSYISKLLTTFLFIAGLILTPNLIRAQEQPQSDEEKEYKASQDIEAEKDQAKKTEMIFNLLKEKPKGKYAVAEYQNLLAGLKKEANWKQMIVVCERFLKMVPDDALSISALTVAYSETKNTKGFVAFAEKAYAANPNGDLAYAIANGYKELGNDAKFMQWGEKAVAANPNLVDLLTDLVLKASAMQNNALAAKYAKTCIKALPNIKKPESVDAQKWKSDLDKIYATNYAVIGQNDYDNRNYAEAIKNLESAVKYFKNMDRAYYLLGDAYWQTNRIGPAELNFAKAYIIKGAVSSAAKKQLDTLWGQTHKGSLAGLDVVIERAKQDLK